jgi:hypothetical protein
MKKLTERGRSGTITKEKGALSHVSPDISESLTSLLPCPWQSSQQISRHAPEARFMRLSEIPMSQIATSEKLNLPPSEFSLTSSAS